METCRECGSEDTRVSMTVDRGGRIVRFRVDCGRCGNFSHYLPHGPLQRAVKEYLDELRATVEEYAEAAVQDSWRGKEFADDQEELHAQLLRKRREIHGKLGTRS